MLHSKLLSTVARSAYSLTYKENRTAVLNASSLSETSISFGNVGPTREIFVFISTNTTATRTISSATIGGVTATISSQYSATTSGVACLFATVPTGNTGTVSITFNGTVVSYIISVYEVRNRPNIGASHTAVTQGASLSYSNGFVSGSLETLTNGFSIGMSAISGDVVGAVSINNDFVIDASQLSASSTYTGVTTTRNKIGLTGQTNSVTTSWTGTKSCRWAFWSFN